ncbi:MAG: DUF1684 domain-containing protein [Calditrichae bacterium]|nr:DUF1684 domain-containing protein [Calditrichota bacterium]MCB9058333.1 DUF1684 domain-containing protein [Calditrichia bacterium]
MNFHLKNILIIVTIFNLSGVFAQSANADSQYSDSIDKWHNKRIASLKKSNSWLTLAGLYWLEPGKNTFGSSPENDLVFPEKAEDQMGYFQLQDSIVTIFINTGIPVKNDSVGIQKMELKNDNQQNTTILTYKSLSWYIIKRDDMYGVRLKDSEHPNLKNFTGIERFPVDQNWRIKAHLLPGTEKKIQIPNVLGQVSDAPCPGTLVFKINGEEYRLDPIADKDDQQYWIIFSDATNGEETYGAGRFLYIDSADEQGNTFIDFNKSYNPPCVFSPYATCPLPPRQNNLDIKITAGEKNYEHESH